MGEGFLNEKVSRDFRDAINSSPIFANDEKYLSQYNLSCAVMDRLDSAVRKLNTYGDIPTSEEGFLVFMMYASMVKDAMKELFKALQIDTPQSDTQYFRDCYQNSRIYNPDKDIPSDDKFFEYLRSLVFAHPFETSRARFLREKETQYSPWVFISGAYEAVFGCKNNVGVRIYSSLSEDIIDLRIPFETLKAYIVDIYSKLSDATNWAYAQIDAAESIWKQHKINRSQSTEEILQEIINTLNSRFEDTSSVEQILRNYRCTISDDNNKVVVNNYKKEIESIIPLICDAVDELNEQDLSDIVDVLYGCPRLEHEMAYYQLEKVNSYLGHPDIHPVGSEDWMWGRRQAENFYNAYAKKYVFIDTEMMSDEEIKLLITISCHLGYKAGKEVPQHEL